MLEAENTPEISVHYIGPAVENGRIDLFVLSDGLRGLGRLTSRVSYLMFGSDLDYRIELDGEFQSGSVIIPLHVLTDAVANVENALLSRHGQALSSLLTILGWGAVSGALNLYRLFKQKKGRPITDEDDLARILARLDNIEQLLFIKIYNDAETQAALRATLRPLRMEGIVEFQTRRREFVVETVSQSDLKSADEAEEGAIQEVEEKVLDIEKVALVPHLSWHFSDDGSAFDARIQDPALWERVARGERFGYGDRMRVELRTTFHRDSGGRLNLERTIPRVIEVEHAIQPQPKLWSDENS
jgi:DNA-binding transcriptional ArsR family regulator